MSRERKLTDLEKAQWSEATKDVKPLVGKVRVPKKLPQDIQIQQIQESRANIDYDKLTTDPFKAKAVFSKLVRSQKVVIEGRLDLHGLTLRQAEHELKKYLLFAQENGKRWLLVITGKGSLNNDHTLRQIVPKWLDQWHLVSSYMIAKQRDGGNGALYVYLRKVNRGD